jgi:hypothetical protein
MNIRQIFQNARLLVSDVQHSTNNSDSDTFVQDSQLLNFLNDGITYFDFLTGIERFAYEDGDFTINVVAGTDLYTLPPNIAKIDTVQLENGNNKILLEEVAYENIVTNRLLLTPNDQYLTLNLRGDPVYYSLDYDDQKIKLFPIPSQNWTLKMRGTYYQTIFTQSDYNKTVPFPAKFHQAFVYYLASRMTEIIDFDVFDIKMSQYYMSKFNEIVRMAKLEQSKLERQNAIWTNGAYNV